jgi:hypothetical protein
MSDGEGRATWRSHDTQEEEAIAARNGHVQENNTNRNLKALYRALALNGRRGI